MERGFALPLVLWALMLAAAAGAVASRSAQTATLRATTLETAAMTRVAADAGVALATVAVLRAVGTGAPVPRRIACRLGVTALAITIEDEHGKIDLNRASLPALAALFGILDLAEPEALAERVGDHRDADGLRRLNGAEREDYARAGALGPADGPFTALDGLARVLGWPAVPPERLAAHLTVHGGTRVDPALASDPVLDVVRTLGAEARAFAPSPRERYRIAVQAEAPPGARTGTLTGTTYTRIAVVALSRRQGQPPRILAWARGRPGNPAAEAEPPPCV